MVWWFSVGRIPSPLLGPLTLKLAHIHSNNFTITPAGATPGYNPGAIQAGTWNVVLGPYESVPEGIDWELQIEMGFDKMDETFSPAYAQVDMNPFCNACQETTDYTWQRGDFHMHTVHSDGQYTPAEQMEHALSQDLSFIFLSDHNTDTSNTIAGVAQRQTAPDLLVSRAIEVTTRYGHWQAVGLGRDQNIEWRYTPDDNPGFAAAAAQVHKAGGFVSVNHPFADCPACNWSLDWDHNDAIEVWNAIWDPTDEKAVQKWQELLVVGRFMTAIGGSDSHSPPSLNGLPTTVVKARGRSQGAIVEGVRAARAYIVRGPGMDLAFEVEDASLPAPAQIGDKLSIGSAGATVVFSATGFAGQKACFLTDEGYFYNTSIVDGSAIRRSVPSGADFVRAEVRNAASDDMLGLTNPVWFLE
jgi:predicted metal-dependent phosphoesterase TrpH